MKKVKKVMDTRDSTALASQWKSFRKSWNRYWELYLFLIPVIAYFLIFHYGPMLGAQIAFKDFNPIQGIWGSPWAGFKHFIRFFNSYQFERVLCNTISISLLSILFSFPMPILLAIILEELIFRRFSKVLQTVTYSTHFISTVVLVGMMSTMFSLRFGVVNNIIRELGFQEIHFFAEPGWFKPLYIGSGIWQNMGWDAIIYISAIAGIDQELFEAAKIDGANKFNKIFYVTLPSIAPTIIILLIMRFGHVMSVGFMKVFLMQNAQNVQASEVISTFVYKSGMLNQDFSFSTAIDLFNSIINFTLIMIVNHISKKVTETSLW